MVKDTNKKYENIQRNIKKHQEKHQKKHPNIKNSEIARQQTVGARDIYSRIISNI